MSDIYTSIDGNATVDLQKYSKRYEDEITRLRAEVESLRKCCTQRGALSIKGWQQENAELQDEILRLQKLATQRGARMQIMLEWMNKCSMCETCGDLSSTTDWYKFLQEHPSADKWFDKDGVPVDA